MTDTTDLEITRSCANFYQLPELPGGSDVWGCVVHFSDPERKTTHFLKGSYRPLEDDAQNADLNGILLKHGYFNVTRKGFEYVLDAGRRWFVDADMTVPANYRRARCLAVYKIWESLK